MEKEFLAAIQHGQHHKIKLLHEKDATLMYSKHKIGFYPNTGKDVYGTVLNFATKIASKKTVSFLIEEFKLDIQEVGQDGLNCILTAVEGGHIETVNYLHSLDTNLIKAKDRNGYGALCLASAFASKEMVQSLVEKLDADVFETDLLGTNCFHSAVVYDRIKTLPYLDSICPELSQAKTNDGLTAWDFAVDDKSKDSVEYLIERAFPDQKAVFLASEDSCVECCDAQPSVIFLPCNHTVACKNCVKTNYQKFKKCPNCKSKIDFVYTVELDTVETMKKLKRELEDYKIREQEYKKREDIIKEEILETVETVKMDVMQMEIKVQDYKTREQDYKKNLKHYSAFKMKMCELIKN